MVPATAFTTFAAGLMVPSSEQPCGTPSVAITMATFSLPPVAAMIEFAYFTAPSSAFMVGVWPLMGTYLSIAGAIVVVSGSVISAVIGVVYLLESYVPPSTYGNTIIDALMPRESGLPMNDFIALVACCHLEFVFVHAPRTTHAMVAVEFCM